MQCAPAGVPAHPIGKKELAVDEREFRRKIRERCLLFGEFRLRSGKISDRYFDKYRFESDPELLREVAARMARLLPEEIERLAGLEMGGIPLATAISLHTGLPTLFVRKKAKDYGTCNLAEGGFRPGERVAVIEDVITTAGQVVESANALRALGLDVVKVVCVVDRQQGGTEKLAEAGYPLARVFTLAEIESA
jgi:orotate phosphoribosyltransferase